MDAKHCRGEPGCRWRNRTRCSPGKRRDGVAALTWKQRLPRRLIGMDVYLPCLVPDVATPVSPQSTDTENVACASSRRQPILSVRRGEYFPIRIWTVSP